MLANKACCRSHLFGQLLDRAIHAGAHIQKGQRFTGLIFGGIGCQRTPAFQREYAGITQIINMQKLP